MEASRLTLCVTLLSSRNFEHAQQNILKNWTCFKTEHASKVFVYNSLATAADIKKSSRFSESNVSELLEYLEEMFLCTKRKAVKVQHACFKITEILKPKTQTWFVWTHRVAKCSA